MDIDPFLRPHGDLPVEAAPEPGLDQVGVLYAKNIARADHRAGVVHLVDIFEGDRDMAGTQGEDLAEALQPLGGDKSFQIFQFTDIHAYL